VFRARVMVTKHGPAFDFHAGCYIIKSALAF
jgi:hypothetical protein